MQRSINSSNIVCRPQGVMMQVNKLLWEFHGRPQGATLLYNVLVGYAHKV